MAALRAFLLSVFVGFWLTVPAVASPCGGVPTSSVASDLSSLLASSGKAKPNEIKPGGGEIKPGGGEIKPGGGEATGTSPAAVKAAPPKTKPPAKGTSKAFRTLTQGEAPTVANAPRSLTLPTKLNQGLQKSWDGSLPKGKAQEQGGILVVDGKGDLTWRQGAPGTEGWFSTNYDDAKAGETILADVHTHPYTKKEGGFTGVSFSGGDYGAMLYQDHRLSLVQSGDVVYAVATTQEWEKATSGLIESERTQLYNEIQATWDANFDGTNFVSDAENAAKVTATKYGLVLYKGVNGGTLKRIN